MPKLKKAKVKKPRNISKSLITKGRPKNLPATEMKVFENGAVTMTSNFRRVEFLLNELMLSALYDVGNYIRAVTLTKMRKLPGMRKGRRASSAIQFWARKKELDVQIGYGHSKQGRTGDTWYAIQAELGLDNQPKRALLRNAVAENINHIIEIQKEYLTGLNDEQQAINMIYDIGEEGGGSDGEDPET